MAQVITKTQIVDLIRKKIAGQGSAVDVGGALPAILEGLANMGISSDMSETEQMQARKDLGLYYEETGIGEKTAKYNGESGSQTMPGYYQVSEDAPEISDIIKVIFNGNVQDDFATLVQTDGYVILDPYGDGPVIRVVLNDSAGNAPGIYMTGLLTFNPELVYNGTTTVVSKVPERFLPVAWNQLVTEGTKIAEVTIGEETTDIYAPGGGGGAVKEIESSFVAANLVNLTETYGITEEEFAQMKSGQIAFIKTSGDGRLYSVFAAVSSQYVNSLFLAKISLNGSMPEYILINGSVTSCNIMIVGTSIVSMITPQSGADLTDEQFYSALGINAVQFMAISVGHVRSIMFGMSMTCHVDIYGSNILSLGGGKIYAVKDTNGWQLTVS